MGNNLKLKFCGGTNSVTGANFLLFDEKNKILIDCGLQQGVKGLCEKDPNRKPFKYNPAEIDFLIITHAHIDHIGLIPKLVKDGFRGKIFSTPATREIAEFMFEDAVKLTAQEAHNCRIEPLFSDSDTNMALSLWEVVPYHKKILLNQDFELFLNDAGHILGSSIVNLKYLPTNKKIVFTGDLGNSPTPLIRETEKIKDADYLIMESVYGDRNHEGKSLRKEKLKKIINEVIRAGGTLLIPVFSLEKTQVLLHELNDLIEGGEVPSVPVFFDSPLGINLTTVYEKQFENFNKKVQDRIKSGDDIFDFPKLIKTREHRESKEIHKIKGAKIIIASSGMSIGGRILDHEKYYLGNPKNAILFIGYQVTGSLGRAISENKKKVRIGNQTFKIKAKVFIVSGYSSHMDSDHLLDFVANTAETLTKVYVVMGEPKSSLFLTQKINDNLNVKAISPKEGETVDLV